MVKDKSADERCDYNQKILQTERKQDELKYQKHKIQVLLDNFETTISREFQKLLEIDDDLMKCGSFSAKWDFDENQEKARYIKNLIAQQQDDFTYAFSEESQRLEDERETLQKERNELPWD